MFRCVMNRRLLHLLSISILSVCCSIGGCKEKNYSCKNGVCTCKAGQDCDIDCEAPPCHIVCEDPGTHCDAVCGNGDCTCKPGSECDFTCHSPPCHVTCHEDTLCTGVCANGDCTCGAGSVCDFDCMAGPCHVHCEGDHESCSGVCANGSCTCGANSSCRFGCLDGNCKTHCLSGSSCVLDCRQGEAGGEGCSFDTCAAGEAEVCPGNIVVCGTACPATESPPLDSEQ
jgi:hypothetical protein